MSENVIKPLGITKAMWVKYLLKKYILATVLDAYIDDIIVAFIINVFSTILEFIKVPYLRLESHVIFGVGISCICAGNSLVRQLFGYDADFVL